MACHPGDRVSGQYSRGWSIECPDGPSPSESLKGSSVTAQSARVLSVRVRSVPRHAQRSPDPPLTCNPVMPAAR